MLLKKKIKNHTSKKKESPKKRKKNKFNWVRTSQKETKSFKPEEEEEGERESERGVGIREGGQAFPPNNNGWSFCVLRKRLLNLYKVKDLSSPSIIFNCAHLYHHSIFAQKKIELMVFTQMIMWYISHRTN